MLKLNQPKAVLVFVVTFLGLFCLLFYGTEAVIGLSSPDHVYNAFVAEHLNYIVPFRRFLLLSVQQVTGFWGYQTHFPAVDSIAVVGGKGVQMGYSCIGYGLLSFWIAFVLANQGTTPTRKWTWILIGCPALIALNVLRVSLLLVAINRNWPIPFGWDHHTWFNLVSYALIFLMIYGFDRGEHKIAGKPGLQRTAPVEGMATEIKTRPYTLLEQTDEN